MGKAFYYIKIRKKGTPDFKALREDGKILVFNNYGTAHEYAKSKENSVYKIITLAYHPMHKKSPIYRKKYKKIGW